MTFILKYEAQLHCETYSNIIFKYIRYYVNIKLCCKCQKWELKICYIVSCTYNVRILFRVFTSYIIFMLYFRKLANCLCQRLPLLHIIIFSLVTCNVLINKQKWIKSLYLDTSMGNFTLNWAWNQRLKNVQYAIHRNPVYCFNVFESQT
jgi:hypothetical protein